MPTTSEQAARSLVVGNSKLNGTSAPPTEISAIAKAGEKPTAEGERHVPAVLARSSPLDGGAGKGCSSPGHADPPDVSAALTQPVSIVATASRDLNGVANQAAGLAIGITKRRTSPQSVMMADTQLATRNAATARRSDAPN